MFARLLRWPLARLAHAPRSLPLHSIRRISQPVQFSPLLAESLLLKCSSCGIAIQKDNAQQPGFYIEPQAKKTDFKKPADRAYDQFVAQLDEQDRQLLLNGAQHALPTTKAAKTAPPSKRSSPRCLRCVEASQRSSFPASEFPIEPVAAVMEQVPPHAQLVYVVDAMDFPMSLSAEVFKYRAAKNVVFVVTKTDLLFGSLKAAVRKSQFFADYLYRKHGVAPENVVFFLGKMDWNAAKLLAMVRDDAFFVGGVNSGKSLVIQALVLEARHTREQLHRDKYGPHLVVRQQRREVDMYKSTHGPGASFMPGFTRGILPVQLSSKVTIWDVPGFGAGSDEQLAELVAPRDLRRLMKGAHLEKCGMHLSHYDTAKEERVVTVGGLFKLHVPRGAMFRVRNVVNHKLRVLRSEDKVASVWEQEAEHEPRDKTFVVRRGTPYRKYLVPWFYGPVDLVVRHFGHVSITPTGAHSGNTEPVVVYLPEGVDAVVRQPIVNYLTHTLAGRDKNGNVLRKEHWAAKSVTELKRYTGREPFYTRLVPMPDSAENNGDFLAAHLAEVNGAVVLPAQLNEHNRYVNWVE